MVTHDNAEARKTYFGKAADEKPTGKDVANGSVFIEMDTSKIYFYDAAGAQWTEWGAEV